MGGGRWARVLADELSRILPPGVPLTVCSPSAANSVKAWAVASGLEKRVNVTSAIDDLNSETVVIVANSARDHVATARWALSRGAAVLVEKPMAFTMPELRALMADAKAMDCLLAPAQVLRFVRYLPNFAAQLEEIGEISTINVEWRDPAGEVRYGERKTYDAGTPLHIDVLPHIVSAIQAVFRVLPLPDGPPLIAAGGAHVDLQLKVGDWPCAVTLERNATERKRKIVVCGSQGNAILNFTKEPGSITIGKTSSNADPLWSSGPRPLESLLSAFLHANGGAPANLGLSLDTAEATCLILDTVRESYERQRIQFLINNLSTGAPIDGPLGYALSEFLQSHSRSEGEELSRQIALIRQTSNSELTEKCTGLEHPEPGKGACIQTRDT